jgi:hypothetical protein
VICELHWCLVQERGLVVTYKVGFSTHYICGLVVESGGHWLILVAVSALNNIGAVVPLIICSGMNRSAAYIIRVEQLISQDFYNHLLLIRFIVLYPSKIIYRWCLLIKH